MSRALLFSACVTALCLFTPTLAAETETTHNLRRQNVSEIASHHPQSVHGEYDDLSAAPEGVKKAIQYQENAALDIGHKVKTAFLEAGANKPSFIKPELDGSGDSYFALSSGESFTLEEWQKVVDSEGIFRGSATLPIVLISFDDTETVRTARFKDDGAAVVDIMYNYTAPDCSKGGFYDDNILESVLSSWNRDKIRSAYGNEYLSVSAQFAAMSANLYDLDFYVVPTVISLSQQFDSCLPYMECDGWKTELFDKLETVCPECFADISPSGRPWSISGSRRNIAYVHENATNARGDEFFAFQSMEVYTGVFEGETYEFNRFMVAPFFTHTCKMGDVWCNPYVHTPGTHVHELGHLLLDLPDLYDYSYQSHGVGTFDLMGNSHGVDRAVGGDVCTQHTKSWQNDGQRPPMMSAANRYLLGWGYPVDVDQEQSMAIVSTYVEALTDAGCVNPNFTPQPILIKKDDNRAYLTTETYLLELRLPSLLEPCLPGGGGLMIFHLDASVQQHHNASYPGDGKFPEQHYRIAVKQQDGQYHLERKINNGEAEDMVYTNLLDYDSVLRYTSPTDNTTKTFSNDFHNTLSAYARWGSDFYYEQNIQDYRSLKITWDASGYGLVDVIINPDFAQFVESHEYVMALWSTIGDKTKVDVSPVFSSSSSLLNVDIAKYQSGWDHACVNFTANLLTDPVAVQTCYDEGFYLGDVSCVAACAMHVNPFLNEKCGLKENIECTEKVPIVDAEPDPSCGDFIMGTPNSYLGSEICQNFCIQFESGQLDGYCASVLSVVGLNDVPVASSDIWVQAKCTILALSGSNYYDQCMMIDRCNEYEQEGCSHFSELIPDFEISFGW